MIGSGPRTSCRPPAIPAEPCAAPRRRPAAKATVRSPSGSICCTRPLAGASVVSARRRSDGRMPSVKVSRAPSDESEGGKRTRPIGVANSATIPGHVPRQRVHMRRTDLGRDIEVAGRLVQFVWRPLLHGAPFAHHGDFLAHRHRLELVGRRVDDGHPELPVKSLELSAHIVTQFGVEIGERLVEQQYLWPSDQRTSERHALLFAARKRGRLLLQSMRKAQHFRRLAHPLVNLWAARRPPQPEDRRGCDGPRGADRGRRTGKPWRRRGP